MSLETREVLADAYELPLRGRLLTHAVELGPDGYPVKVLCRRVMLSSLVDRHGTKDPTAPPTCPVCARRWRFWA